MTAEKQERIFLVDDEQINLRVLQALLTTAGYTNLEMISDARKVAPAHKHNRADLVLLDLTMPDIDGFEVIEQLNALEEIQPPAILVLTGHADEETMDQAYRTGANGYITKPITAPELLAAVRNALDSQAGPAGADNSVDDKQQVP